MNTPDVFVNNRCQSGETTSTNSVKCVKWYGELPEDKSKTVRIRISDTCNQNCGYCSEHDNFKVKFLTLDKLTIILDNLLTLFYEDGRKVNLFVWGGEPLLNPDLFEFIKLTRIPKYKNMINNIELHSNLVVELKHEQLTIIKDSKVTVSSSLHLEYHRNFNRIRDNLISLRRYEINIFEINIMLHHLLNFKMARDLRQEFQDFPVSIVPTFQLIKSSHRKLKAILPSIFMEKTIPTFEGPKNYIDFFHDFNPEGIKCRVPVDSFIINTDGKVYFCQEHLFDNRPSGIDLSKPIPKKHSKVKAILSTARICRYKQCSCERTIFKG